MVILLSEIFLVYELKHMGMIVSIVSSKDWAVICKSGNVAWRENAKILLSTLFF